MLFIYSHLNYFFSHKNKINETPSPLFKNGHLFLSIFKNLNKLLIIFVEKEKIEKDSVRHKINM